MSSRENSDKILVLGIGNLLMGDEGVGVHLLRYLQGQKLPDGVECLDGGTGGFQLLGPMQDADKIILIDATCDNSPVGTMKLLRPRFARDYPLTLSAHDIGLKDILDAFYLIDKQPDIRLLAITIAEPQGMSMELSPILAAKIPVFAQQVVEQVRVCLKPAAKGQ